MRRLPRHDLTHPDGRAFHLYGHDVGRFDEPPADTDAGVGAGTSNDVGRFDDPPADIGAGTSNDVGRFDDPPAGTAGGAVAGAGAEGSRLQRRFDRLNGVWVLVSPSRNVRPSATATGEQAPVCPLCPGGPELPGGFDVAVFDNRFPSVSPSAPDGAGPLLAPAGGRCQIVVFTAAHVEQIEQLSPQQLVDVIAVLRDRTAALWADGYEYVMAFENHGNEVGATLSHLHGQLYAFDHLPPVTATKLGRHDHHRATSGTCLGCTLVDEDRAGGRVVHEGDHFVAAVPFAPRWPLEVHVRAARHGLTRLAELTDEELVDLVRTVAGVIARYGGLWGFELPYLLCIQEAPPASAGPGTDDWHLHVELLPPHRTADRLKIRASVETALGVFIYDAVPEETAARLAAVEIAEQDWDGVAAPRIEPVP